VTRQDEAIPQEASNDMLEQPNRLLLHQLGNHVAEHSSYRIEPLVSLTDVGEPHIIQQDLLNDEDGHRLGKFGAGLHDAEAQWDDLGGQQEIDDIGGIIFDQCTDNAERGQAKVFERPGFRRGIEERVQKERDVRYSLVLTSVIHCCRHHYHHHHRAEGDANHARTSHGCRCAKRRTAAEPAHYTLYSTRPPSSSMASATGKPK